MKWIAVLVIVLGCLAAAAFAAGPNDPEITAEHTVSAKIGTVTFCITVNADRLDGKVFDVEFIGPWAPGPDAAAAFFGAPQGWNWEPIGSGGWRAYSSTPMAKGTKYCFTLPLAPGQLPPDPVNLIATDDVHHPIHNFLSTYAKPPAEKGIHHALWLKVPDDGLATFTLTYSACSGSPAQFQAPTIFSMSRPGTLYEQSLLFLPGGPNFSVSGPVFRNGAFHLRGANAGIDGAFSIDGPSAWRAAAGEYRSTRLGCLETWAWSEVFDRAAGKIVETCPHTRIDAPNRVHYRHRDLRLTLALECGRTRLPRRRIDVYLVNGRKHTVEGSFRSSRKWTHLTIHLGTARPDAVEFRFKSEGFFAGTSRRVGIVN